MLTETQIKEIRSHLEKSHNPLFLFDDDHDGLTSFLLLYKKYKKGHGVSIKASPIAEEIYLRKIDEYHPDRVFVLDRAFLSQDLINQIRVPLIWIDHHEPLERTNVYYYNPMVPKKDDNRPTSHWCYQVAPEEKYLWIAIVGVVGDWHIPDFLNKIQYPELLNGKKTIEELMFDSPIGTLIKVFRFILKGETAEINKCIQLLMEIESPYDILKQQTSAGAYLYKKFLTLNKEYEKVLQEALTQKTKGKIFFFRAPEAKNSFTSIISNELLYRTKYQVLIIGREKDGEMRLSLRGKDVDVLPALKKALAQVDGYGGGHPKACGAGIKMHDFEKFLKLFKKEMTIALKQTQSVHQQ